MLLTFPSLETLRIAIESGAVPDVVSQSAATAEYSPDGHLRVRTEGRISRDARTELGRLGVRIEQTSGDLLPERVLCWPQLLPLEAAADAGFDDRRPVLMELDDPGMVAEIAAEMLRLGNDRQSLCWVADGTQTRALLRVIGPPYYTLLRAMAAPVNGRRQVWAYVESSPRVWVETGFRHPLAARLRPPEGQLLLMRSRRDWWLVDDAKFHDIYGLTDFVLPHGPSTWQPVPVPQRIRIPLRLSPSDSTRPAELWVLAENAQPQLEELVQSVDDRTLARLSFAVGQRGAETRIVLRARPSKDPPPILVLDATPYRAYLKLSHLFLPCAARLDPSLRRDVVESLLAADSQSIVWLEPGPGVCFAAHSLPDSAFRPLTDWVDYVLDQERQPLSAWMESVQFDFEPFQSRDEVQAIAEPPAEQSPAEPLSTAESAVAPQTAPVGPPRKPARPRSRKAVPIADPPSPAPPNELRETLGLLEAEMRKLSSPLEALPRHRRLWEDMAVVNAQFGRQNDAAICAGNALWTAEEPPPESFWIWTQGTPAAETTAEALERILSQESPSGRDVQLMAALLARMPHSKDCLPAGTPGLERIPGFLEKHHSLMGVRLLWLAWLAVFRSSTRDVLTLVRARDRILERLFQSGLSPELDLPGFLRYSGSTLNERLRIVSEHLRHLFPAVQGWLERLGRSSSPLSPGASGTLAFVDLMFAWAFARLGDAGESHRLEAQARGILSSQDVVHQWLARGFAFRIAQALEGRVGGPLSDDLLREVAALDDAPEKVRLKIDRLRECSRILEPSERFDPFRRDHAHHLSPLERDLVLLGDRVDSSELLVELQGFLARTDLSASDEGLVLGAALDRCPRLGHHFAQSVLERVPGLLSRGLPPLQEMELIERALLVAGMYDQPEHVRWLVDRFQGMIGRDLGGEVEKQKATALQRSFSAMRKLGLRAEAAGLLDEVTSRVERTVHREPSRPGGFNDGPVLRLSQLLQLAGAWLSFGHGDRGFPILDEARDLLRAGILPPVFQTSLACGYLAALGQAPVDAAMPRLLDLFHTLENVRDGYLTNSHYSRSQLSVADAALTALFHEDVALDKAGRQWLDDDEYVIRRKIHADVRAALASE